MEALTRRSRAFSRGRSVWSIWVMRTGHRDPFARTLNRRVNLGDWARQHGLRDDNDQPLELTLNRLKTTVEVGTAKTVGGHLPSAARTNTTDVLFSHYLRGDPTVRDWAAEEVTAALVDAEQHARHAHLRVLAGPAGPPGGGQDPARVAGALGVSEQTARQALDGELDTAVAACLDIYHSPFDPQGGGTVCQASFLTCLRCPNALVTARHLPGLLALLDRLEAARQTMDLDVWWQRHGHTWLALTEDALPKFTPAELAHAQATKPTTDL